MAIWTGAAWKVVYPGKNVQALWVMDDWLAIRSTSGAFSLLSRRDGKVEYEQPEGTLVFPWPEAAPIPGERPRAYVR